MAYNPNNPNGQAQMSGSSPVVIASNQTDVPVSFDNGVLNIFSKVQTVGAFNDIDCQFYRDDPTIILSGITGNGGTISAATGYAQFFTSTATNGSAIAYSLDRVTYHAGAEIYAIFTAAWLDGGAASSIQFIGYNDTINGFFIGYSGTVFYTGVKSNGVDTIIPQSGWTNDSLTGSTISKFTRNGTPETINFALLNTFRIRFGWLGVTQILYEVLSPDGYWTIFNQVRQPNTNALPSILNADLPISVNLTKTAGATNLRLNSTNWGAGCTYTTHDNFDVGILNTPANSTLTFLTRGVGSGRIYLGTTTTGTIVFEVTIDGKNWYASPNVIDKNFGGGDLLVPTTGVTITSGATYQASFVGYRAFRIRATSTLGAIVNVAAYLDNNNNLVSIVSNVNAPHNIGYNIIHKDGEYTTTQTGVSIWVPTGGKKFVVTDFTVAAGGTTSGVFTLWDATSGNTAYVAGTNPALFRGEFAPSANSKPGIVKQLNPPYISTTVNNILRVTTSTNITVYVQVNGYEI